MIVSNRNFNLAAVIDGKDGKERNDSTSGFS
jgi:hypothetical protein